MIEELGERLGVIERKRKRDIVKLMYSLVLSAGSDDSGALAEAMKRYNTERVVRGAYYARNTPGPCQVGDLYRVRYDIELENKLDKSGGQLDQIRATTESSVKIQLAAKLLHALSIDVPIHRDNLERTRKGYVCRGPLHRLAVAYTLRARRALLVTALIYCDLPVDYGDHLSDVIADEGRGPNWRRRHSVLDCLHGLTDPPGRPRKR